MFTSIHRPTSLCSKNGIIMQVEVSWKFPSSSQIILLLDLWPFKWLKLDVGFRMIGKLWTQLPMEPAYSEFKCNNLSCIMETVVLAGHNHMSCTWWPGFVILPTFTLTLLRWSAILYVEGSALKIRLTIAATHARIPSAISVTVLILPCALIAHLISILS